MEGVSDSLTIGPLEVVRQVRVQTARRQCTLFATHTGGLCLVVFMWTFWFISSHPLTFSTQSHPKIHPEHMLWIAWARFESSQTSPQAMVTIYITVLQLLDDCVLWVDGGRTVESCCAGVYQGCAGVLGCQSRAVRNVLKQCSGPDCSERSYYLVLLAG